MPNAAGVKGIIDVISPIHSLAEVEGYSGCGTGPCSIRAAVHAVHEHVSWRPRDGADHAEGIRFY
jgi:hypothetical protein